MIRCCLLVSVDRYRIECFSYAQQVVEGASALAVALVICFLGSELAAALGFAGASISVITAVTVALATAAPRHLRSLIPSAEGLACIILQVVPSAPCCWASWIA